jgi:hypothetical protein
MRNAEIAAALRELGILYELDGADRFRVLAYREAARTIAQSPVSIEQLAEEGRLTELPNVGKTLAQKIETLIETGSIPSADKLKEKFPATLVEVTRVPGLGAKTARRIYDEVGVESLTQLKEAAGQGRIATIRGLGPRTEARLFGPWSLCRQRLGGVWPDLPKGPVHADFAEYNVLLDETENIAAVIDFNLCGDDVFVNELVHACLRLPSSGEDEDDRFGIARFIGAYETLRPLSASERLAVPYLISVIRPFRWREVRPLVRAADRGDGPSTLRHLARLEGLLEPARLLG